MKVLAVNPGHNGSVALVEDGKILYYIEEERLSRSKYDGNPFVASLPALQNHKVDILVLGGTSSGSYPQLTWTGENLFHGFARKFNKDIKVIDMSNYHHLGHAAGSFYNSGFDEAISIVVDGCGSVKASRKGTEQYAGHEVESAYVFKYPAKHELVYSSIAINDPNQKPFKSDDFNADNAVPITKAYEAVTDFLGWHFIEAGKTMGLAPYGEEDPDMPQLFDESTGRCSRDLVAPMYPGGAVIRTDTEQGKYFIKGNPRSKDWHNDKKKVNKIAKNLAWQIQQTSQKLVGDLIERLVKETGIKNVCISGGYGLNCMANYYYKKRFPNINIYNDPVSHDGGTTIGLAKLISYKETRSKEKHPLETLYLGLEESVDYSALDTIDTTKFKVVNATDADIAKMLQKKKIVSYYQGKSEAGPRALGNRSILYTPLDPKGKDFVNKVKGREWFRPFAGSMLQEHFEDWFETYGMKETPFMMYAMDFKDDKKQLVPSITHVDGTCRIQTVTKDQNKHYYNLINEFYKLTGVPIVFNTSFNLGGEPLVETVQDAIWTLDQSNLNYLYFPEISKLVEKL